MSFEEDLRRALTRKDPPPGFAERVLARIREASRPADSRRPTSASRRGVLIRWLAAAAVFLPLVVGTGRYYAHRKAAAEAERVTQEVKVALRIASEKLHDVQLRLEEISRREF